MKILILFLSLAFCTNSLKADDIESFQKVLTFNFSPEVDYRFREILYGGSIGMSLHTNASFSLDYKYSYLHSTSGRSYFRVPSPVVGSFLLALSISENEDESDDEVSSGGWGLFFFSFLIPDGFTYKFYSKDGSIIAPYASLFTHELSLNRMKWLFEGGVKFGFVYREMCVLPYIGLKSIGGKQGAFTAGLQLQI